MTSRGETVPSRGKTMPGKGETMPSRGETAPSSKDSAPGIGEKIKETVVLGLLHIALPSGDVFSDLAMIGRFYIGS